MTDPTNGESNPSQVEAVYQALIHSNTPVVSLAERRMHEGLRYQVSTSQRPLTTTQGSLYLYIENNNGDGRSYDTEPPIIYAGSRTIVDAYKNADVNVGTFTQANMSNLKSGNTMTPDLTAYRGLNNGVTITNKGTNVGQTIVGGGTAATGQRQFGTGAGRPPLVVDDGDNLLIEIQNDSGGDVNVTIDTRLFRSVLDTVSLE